ncbi:RNA 3'-terminal-phosphate cyclase [Thioalkalivibrio denitrificans]|uniref:RNA 3'-terminal phosphate cyclase n=1 Tax=Thioalkalivibrio denitrificans TaxID=108003 RepID=A0A1V3NMX6_9GAMM|nr:RNA 3'-terminal phosphate cyclase [Thioalkalivibrio denitrificans]OOG26410.1 RNA 3'-terminal-phosphate cyclase [Thioalkalivibrio denitrificans]
MTQEVHIDGTMGEGGGQVLRSSLTLALLTGRPVRLTRIRARRDRPGLGFQHRMAVHAAARISRARVDGDRVGSQDLEFVPGPVVPGDYHFDIGTAGNTSLVLQTVLLPLALAPGASTVGVTGGTHVPLSPCFHYLDWHWRTMLSRLGLGFDLRMTMAGFYPQGGGEIHAAIRGDARIDALDLRDRGRLLEVHGLSAVANLPEEIAQRQRGRALRGLAAIDCPVHIAIESLPARSQGTVLVLLARFEHSQACFFALGARGKRAERVADEAVEELLAFLATDGAVDRWLADQLLLPLACAGGPSVFRTGEVTLHLLTHAEVIRRFLPVTIRIDGEPGAPGTVHVNS